MGKWPNGLLLSLCYVTARHAKDGYLNEGLEALVSGVQVLVEVDRLVMAAAELSVNLLHALCVGA